MNKIDDNEESAFGSLADDYRQLKSLELRDADIRKYFEELCNSPVVVVSEDQRFLFVNKPYERLSGFSKKELTGAVIAEYTNQPAEEIKKRLAKRKQNIYEQYESHLFTKNSGSKTVWLDSRPLRDKNDHFLGAFITIKDIQEERDRETFIKHNTDYLEKQIEKRTRELKHYTELMQKEIMIREEAQAALFSSEQRFRSLFYNSPDAVFVEELDGTIIDINYAASAMYGFLRKDMQGRNIREFLKPEIDESFEKRQKWLLRQKIAYFEIEIRHRNGHWIPVVVKSAVIQYGTKDVVLFHVRDISERIRNQRALEAANKILEEKVKERTRELETKNEQLQSEVQFRLEIQSQLTRQRNFLQMLIDINPNLIFIKDKTQRYVLVNNAFARFIGKNKEEIIGKSPVELEATKELHKEFEKQDEQVLKQPETQFEFSLEFKGQKECGKFYKTVKQAVKGLTEDDFLIMGVMTDLTELKQHEEQLTQSNAELERFAYIASHDLQSPLKTVISFLQLLEHRYGNKLGADGREFIEHSVSASQRMRQLITDLLHYSRLNSSLKFSGEVDCNKLLFVVTKNLEASIQNTRALIHVENLPTITAEPYLMVQLLQNLISNSIKFVKDKQPVIHVSATEKEDYWQFSISDNGIGIGEEYQQTIFNMFLRLHGNSKYSGTGIGLAICKKVVEQHHGKIWFKSENNNGTTFFFTIAKNIMR